MIVAYGKDRFEGPSTAHAWKVLGAIGTILLRGHEAVEASQKQFLRSAMKRADLRCA